jgi:hypothetical protein
MCPLCQVTAACIAPRGEVRVLLFIYRRQILSTSATDDWYGWCDAQFVKAYAPVRIACSIILFRYETRICWPSLQ